MVIGVDLDEVLADSWQAVIEFHNKVYGTNWRRSEMRTSKFWESLGKTREESYRKIDEFCQSEYFRQVQPVVGSVEAVKELRRWGLQLVIITTRPSFLLIETRDWLDQFFSRCFSAVYHVAEREKSRVCLTEGARILIEDDLENANECAQQGIKVLLFDSPWNQAASLKPAVKRIFSWPEILLELKPPIPGAGFPPPTLYSYR